MSDLIDRLNAALEGRYRIERQLGEGGMATVYLARDEKHSRSVALKVLKPELAAVVGAERFLAEIQTTANLQHPHILPLHDSGEADGLLFYVMPYVEGESLRDRLDRERQLPIADAVRIATNMAEALDYAHRHGVIHRDIKPANVLLVDGKPVISDFGIALAVSSVGGSRMTETGLSLGTPQYMSPEQATGDHPVDERSEVFALGCVLFEMLTGEPAHRGSSVHAIVAELVTGVARRPAELRASIPPHVDAVVHCALERLPADRFPSCADMAKALADPTFRHGTPLSSGNKRALRAWRAAAVASMTGLVALLGWVMLGSPDPGRSAAGDPVVFTIPFEEPEGYASNRPTVAISPTGSHVAFVEGGVAQDRLRLRALDGSDSWVIPGSVGALDPFFSADGAMVGYLTVDGIFRVPVEGGVPTRILGFAEPRGLSWGGDGWIYFGSYAGLWRAREDGTDLEQLSELRTDRGESMHGRPFALPRSRQILFTIARGDREELELAVLDLDDGGIVTLGQGLSPRLTSGGLLFGRPDGSLALAPYDPGRRELTGPGRTVLEGIVTKPTGLEYDVSRSGHLVYLGGTNPLGRLVTVGPDGSETVLSEASETYNSPRYSPDGDRLSIGIGSPPTRQVWIFELGQDPPVSAPLTWEGHNYYGLWTPDGTEMAFARETGTEVGVYLRATDGSGAAERLLGDGELNYPEVWAPDGQTLLIRVQDAVTGLHDIVTIRRDAPNLKQPLLTQPANEESPRLSPDGRWLAYASDISGRLEVYLTSFPEPGGRRQVSASGGQEPVWSPDGRELFYWRADTLVSARIDPDGDVLVSERTDVLAGPYIRWPFHANYDVHPYRREFVMIRREPTSNRRIFVSVNWLANLPRSP